MARAFTLIELIVVLAIIAILMSMIYPMYMSMSERAKATKDMSNLRQIGLATQLYMNDNGGVLFSTTGSWMSQLYNADPPPSPPKYLSSWGVFVSPFDRQLVQEPLHPRTRTRQSVTESMERQALSECLRTRSRSPVFLSCLPQLRLQARL